MSKPRSIRWAVSRIPVIHPSDSRANSCAASSEIAWLKFRATRFFTSPGVKSKWVVPKAETCCSTVSSANPRGVSVGSVRLDMMTRQCSGK